MPPPLPLTSPNIIQSLPLLKACSRQGINNRTWHTRKHQPWRPKSDLDEWNCSRNKSSRRNRNSVASCCLSLRNMASSIPSEWNRCLKQSNNTILSTFHVWQRWSSCWPSCLPDPHNKCYSYFTSMSDFTDVLFITEITLCRWIVNIHYLVTVVPPQYCHQTTSMLPTFSFIFLHPMSFLSGLTVTVNCPLSGHPISHERWSHCPSTVCDYVCLFS